jgi:hypothetical protein
VTPASSNAAGNDAGWQQRRLATTPAGNNAGWQQRRLATTPVTQDDGGADGSRELPVNGN